MVTGLLKKIFGSRNDRLLKQYKRIVAQINSLEQGIASLDDAALQAKTAEFKSKLAAGQTIDEILPEAFAVVREASKRVMNMRHFDVQMIGAAGRVYMSGTTESVTKARDAITKALESVVGRDQG